MSLMSPIASASEFSDRQLELIRRTVAADCNPQEFDLFCEVARRTGLDPFRKQISAIVFSKGDESKRKMAIITTIDGLRTIAARSRRYRPDEDDRIRWQFVTFLSYRAALLRIAATYGNYESVREPVLRARCCILGTAAAGLSYEASLKLVTTYQDNLGDNKIYRELFTQAIKKFEEKDKK